MQSQLYAIGDEYPGLAKPLEIEDGVILDLITLDNSSPGDRYAMLPEGAYLNQEVVLRRVVQPGGYNAPGSKLKIGLAKGVRTAQGFAFSGGQRYAYLTFTDPNLVDVNNIAPAFAVLRWTGNDWLVLAATVGVNSDGTP